MMRSILVRADSWPLKFWYSQSSRYNRSLILADEVPKKRRSRDEHEEMISLIKQGHLDYALQVFENLPRRNICHWITMIEGYGQWGRWKDARHLFEQIQSEGMELEETIFAAIFNACSVMEAFSYGKLIHCSSIKRNYNSDAVVGNALLKMYSKCKSLKDICHVISNMDRRDAISWTTAISAHAEQGYEMSAFKIYRQMCCDGVEPDKVTFGTILDACSHPGFLEEGKLVHAHMIGKKLEFEVELSSAVIRMYGSCGSLEDARALFGKIRHQNVMSWTAMISAYVNQNLKREAWMLFQKMQSEGMEPNRYTFMTILSAADEP